MGQPLDLDKIIEPVLEEILTRIKTNINEKIEERCFQRASKNYYSNNNKTIIPKWPDNIIKPSAKLEWKNSGGKSFKHQ